MSNGPTADTIYNEIAHGDDQHKKWLRNKLDELFENKKRDSMDNQHKKIKGYRDLSQAEIDLMNESKEIAEKVGILIDKLEFSADQLKLDTTWLELGKRDLQTGFMKVIRSIAQPTTF